MMICSTPAVIEVSTARSGYMIIEYTPSAEDEKSASRAGSIDSPPSRPYRFKFGNLSCRNWSKTSDLAKSPWIRVRCSASILSAASSSDSSRWENQRRSVLEGECMYSYAMRPT